MAYKRATDKPVQDDAQEQDLGAQEYREGTVRGHAGTEATSRSARHTPIDPYSIAYAWNLGLPLEL